MVVKPNEGGPKLRLITLAIKDPDNHKLEQISDFHVKASHSNPGSVAFSSSKLVIHVAFIDRNNGKWRRWFGSL